MLNKWNLKVAEFASQEESRYNLKAILVTDKETVGTNGHYLVWVGTPAEHKAESFPVIDHAPKIQDSYSSFLLGVDDAKKVLAALPKKPTIPILATAGVAVKDGQPILEVTDLGCPQVFRPRPPDGKFPNWEVVIPNKKPVFRIAVNAAYLAKVAKMCAEFGNDSRPSVVMSFYGDAEAIRFDVEGRDDRYCGGERQQGMTAMLMPLYLSSATTDDDVRYSYGWAEREAQRQAEQAERRQAEGAAEFAKGAAEAAADSDSSPE